MLNTPQSTLPKQGGTVAGKEMVDAWLWNRGENLPEISGYGAAAEEATSLQIVLSRLRILANGDVSRTILQSEFLKKGPVCQSPPEDQDN
ncbi:hypothetical protein J6590_002884 [Homalodisca vitripennis]|nr:hypothetical protein J6590_002884 [Homalodisca vitripennis]